MGELTSKYFDNLKVMVSQEKLGFQIAAETYAAVAPQLSSYELRELIQHYCFGRQAFEWGYGQFFWSVMRQKEPRIMKRRVAI